MIEHKKSQLSVRKQSELLSINRSRLYYKKEPVDTLDVEIMNEMIEINRQYSFYGYRRMRVELFNRGYEINHKKVRRLMKKTALKALFPKKKTSIANSAHDTYPYLLRDLLIDRPNQVWCIDITYIKIRHGYVYLVCLIDVFSRKIVGWCLSPYLDTQPSLEALESALKLGTPEIINSDQGCQYTSKDWTSALIDKNIKISMDGKGRWADNIPIERFWRSLKYESVYLYSFDTVAEARNTLGAYIDYYNQRRPHQALKYKTPDSVYKEYFLKNQQGDACSESFLIQNNVLANELARGGEYYSQK
jgi:putative transposase